VTNQENTRHRIVVGDPSGDRIDFEKEVGHCFSEKHQDQAYLRIYLWMFPDQKFYLTKNVGDKAYTIFSVVINEDNGEKVFRNPVGVGHHTEEFQSHIQMIFNFPEQRAYIDILPDNRNPA